MMLPAWIILIQQFLLNWLRLFPVAWLRDPNNRYPDMQALINGLDHPETADLEILDKLDLLPNHSSFWQSQAFRGIAIALAILAGFTILAMLLQTLHK